MLMTMTQLAGPPPPTQRPRRPAVLSVANQLTASRLGLSIVLFVLIAAEQWRWGLVVFALAAVTDWLDGYFARVRGQASSLGRVFDPLVDKVLVCGAFIFLLPYGGRPPAGWLTEQWLTPWMVTIVVAREFLITGLRGWLESLGVSFGADWLGKLKMGLQCAALVGVLVALTWPEQPLLALVRDALLYAMLAATILSGLQYLWRAVTILRSDPDKLSSGGKVVGHLPSSSPKG
jgi:CDP-diacylglycerol--glycerol-3-phosphate 3-phosphatidyltransferase